MRKVGHSVFAVVAAVVLTSFASSMTAQEEGSKDVVFRVGKFDRSSAEFAAGSAKRPVNFVAGQSHPAKDWYAIQMATLATAANARETSPGEAARAITFSIDTAKGTYRMHLSLLIESPSVPALKVIINGKQGMFYLDPKLDYANGDQVDSFYPAYSHADVSFDIPGNLLKDGTNTIALQAVEEANEKTPDASFTYDAIELDRENAAASVSSDVRIVPTVFFRQQEGQLREVVDVFLRSSKTMPADASVELTVAGKRYSATTAKNQDFGEQKLEFLVPEFPADTRSEVMWNEDGHLQHHEEVIHPEKKWTVYLVPHIHVDVGYSDYQAKVAAIQARSIEEAMEMTAQHPDFKFSVDGEWDLEQFLRTHNDAAGHRAIEAIKNGQLYVPAQYANLLTGFPSAETLIRSLYPSVNFSRIHGTPFDYANITDVPSYTWSYASILASAGIQYLAGGSNNYRAPVLLQGKLNEASPMWWQGTDGRKVLLWYSRIYQQMQMLFGLPPLMAAGHDTFPLFLQMYEHPGYHANATMMYGTQVENTDLFYSQAELAGKWNNLYAYPHLQYSGFKEALENIKSQFGDDIPIIRGDGGPYWEDGIISDAMYAGLERRNESRAPVAEQLATISSLVNPSLVPDRESLNRMWHNIVLMDEHTWDSYNSTTDPASTEAVEQLAIKDQYAVKAAALADFVAKNTLASIVDGIPGGTNGIIVFNGLNWKRSGPVTMDIPKDQEIEDLETGQSVPLETVHTGDNFRNVRFEAHDVPAIGYKVFQLRPAQSPQPAPEVTKSSTLENKYYRVELDSATGAVRSIYDKQLKRELVNQKSPYRFGQYLYVSGGDKSPNSILQYSHVYPKPELTIHAAQDGTVVSVTHEPDGWVARMHSSATNTPSIATEIRLPDDERKIEFIEDVEKKSELHREAAYFAFPFAMDQPEFQYEIQSGVVNPAKDMYPGAGHEWFSVQHWAAVQQHGVSSAVMPLDAPLVTLGDINRGEWPDHFGDRPGTIFSYIMNNYWDTNYRAEQGGHFQFRYIITSAPQTDPIALSRMGWEEASPLEQDTVTTQDKAIAQPAAGSSPLTKRHGVASLDGKQQSFLNVSDPAVHLEAWKEAEDGNGMILRFLDMGGSDRTVTVQLPLVALKKAVQTDAVERDMHALTQSGDHGFTFRISHNEIVTVRVVSDNVATSGGQ